MAYQINGLRNLPMGDTAQGIMSNAPLFGHLFEDPAQADAVKGFKEASAKYQAYRPMQMDARMKALQGGLGLFQPAIGQLGKMYGQDAVAGFDTSKLYFPTAGDLGFNPADAQAPGKGGGGFGMGTGALALFGAGGADPLGGTLLLGDIASGGKVGNVVKKGLGKLKFW